MGRCNYHYTTLCLNWMYLDVWFQMILSRSHKVIFVWSTWCISGGCDSDKQDPLRETANDSDLRWLQYIILGQPFLPQLHNSQLFFVGRAWHNRPTHMRGEEHWFARLLAQPFRFDLCLSVARMDVSHGIAAWLESWHYVDLCYVILNIQGKGQIATNLHSSRSMWWLVLNKLLILFELRPPRPKALFFWCPVHPVVYRWPLG